MNLSIHSAAARAYRRPSEKLPIDAAGCAVTDIAVFDSDDPRVVGYALGDLHALFTIKEGQLVSERPSSGW